MNYGKLTAGTTKAAIDTAKPSEMGEIIPSLSRMRDVLEEVFKWYKIGQAFFRVLIFCYSDITDMVFRKDKLKIVVHHHVLSAKAAEVFGDDAVDFTGVHILHHPLETRSFKR